MDEQFLLSEMCQEIQNDYPVEDELDWTLYLHRKSLIRAVQALMEFHLIRTIDGDISRFDTYEDQEVLYEATVYSRYFLRSFPDDFTSYADWTGLLEEDWKQNQEDERRKRVYRKLFFSPACTGKIRRTPIFFISAISATGFLRTLKNTAVISSMFLKTQPFYLPQNRGVTTMFTRMQKVLRI